MSKNLKIALSVSFFVSIFLLSSFMSFIYFTTKTSNSKKTPSPSQTQNINQFPYASPSPTDNSLNLLLLGFGGKGHEGGSLTDTLILVHFNPDLKKVNFISIPRDTWISSSKINTAYAQNPDSVKKAVTLVTGLPVNYFLAISFTGFKNAIDTLGGIEVNVPVSFDDYFYPVKGLEELSCDKTPEEIEQINATLSGFLLEKEFPCRYEHLHFDQGLTHMDGATALKFVRSRHSDQHGGDFARSQRQVAVLEGVKKMALSMSALDDLPAFTNQFLNMLETDIKLSDLENISNLVVNPEELEIKTLILNTDNVFVDSSGPSGEYILIPKAGTDNWQEIHTFIFEALNN